MEIDELTMRKRENWKKLVACFQPILKSRVRGLMLGEPARTLRVPVNGSPQRCVICGHMVGSDECRVLKPLTDN